MAIEVKISQLPATDALSGAEMIPIVQVGETVRITASGLRDYTDVSAGVLAEAARASAVATASGYAVDSLNTGKVHTDTSISGVVTVASGYAVDSLNTGKSYTDGEITTLSGYVDQRLDPLEDFKTYDATRTYVLNDPTFYNGVPYKSLSATNSGNQPDISPTYWEVTGGGSGVAVEPGINYSNGQFEAKQILGYATYADAAGTIPVDGTGGTATITFAHSTSSPLIGTGMGLLTKPASNCQGNGVSYDFTIDRGKLNQSLEIDFDYESSTNYADGYMGVYIYDITNSTLMYLSVTDIPASNGQPGHFKAVFLPSTSTSYRLIWHIATTTTTTWTVSIDNVQVGTQNVAGEVSPIIYAFYSNAVTVATATPVNYSTKQEDTHNAVTTGTSWKFTAPISGIYQVFAQLTSSTSTHSRVAIYKNNVLQWYTGTLANVSGTRSNQQALIRLVAGDYIDIRAIDYGMTADSANIITIVRLGS